MIESNNQKGATVTTSDGSTASYYELPEWARELADLIRYKNMNGSQAEMFRALYRGSEASHSDDQRQAKKLLAYAVDEVVRTHLPEESMSEYRNQVFAVFFPETEEAEAESEDDNPDRSCQECSYCIWDGGTKCSSLSVRSIAQIRGDSLARGLGILAGRAYCKGNYWSKAEVA